ncbi:biotin--[acetyl-CoA-carboxylase] ligase [Alicyclobacillus fastidiosus]|nr:biotin--[acetyl-CoA-carboxylase] ligase [Alicyclobacillus fastidiosus]
MWFSILVRRPCAISQAGDLTLLASVAVWRALASMGIPAEIKWPNDLLLNGRKICGILAQMRTDGESVEYAVIGIGMNANFTREQFPPDVREYATTILSEMNREVHRPTLLGCILTELDQLYRDLKAGVGGFAAVRDEWKAHAHTLGRNIRVRIGEQIVEGVAQDVDARGVLALRGEDGTVHAIHSGEVLFSEMEKL